MLRLVSISLMALVLLATAAVILVSFLVDKETLLDAAASQLKERTGATLAVDGDASLSLFPVLGVSLEQASITMPGEEQPGLRAGSLSLGLRLGALISGTVEIDQLAVDGLYARLVSAPDAERVDTSGMNDEELDAFYAARREMREKGASSAGAALGLPLALNVGKLLISDSQIESVDSESGEVTVINITRFRAEGLNLDGTPIPVSMELQIPGERIVTATVDGKVAVNQSSQQVDLQDVRLRLTGATAEPLALVISGEFGLERMVADLDLQLESGDTRGSGKLRYANFESPQIDAELSLNEASPALFVLAGPEAAGETRDTGTGENGDAPLPLDAIRLIDTRAKLAIGKVEVTPHQLSDVKLSLRALEGVITLNSLTAVLHEGKLDLTATFNGKHNTARLVSEGSVESLNVATALAAMESAPVFTGRANLHWQLEGSGQTTNELIEGLTGPITLTTDEPVLRGTNIQRMLCEAVALVNQEKLSTDFPPDTDFQTLGASLALADGKLNLSPLQATLPGVKLTGKGNLELLSEEFKTTFKARLSPELEEIDRACRVSKRLTSIDWPVKCKGNLSDEPAKWCGVDADAIIEDLATNEAKRQLEKEAGKLLDKLFK